MAMTDIELGITEAINREMPIGLGRQRLYVSAAFGDEFAASLEKPSPVFSILNPATQNQVQETLDKFRRKGETITFTGEDNEAAIVALFRLGCFPEFLIGAKVGKEQLGGTVIPPTSDGILMEIQKQLGIPGEKLNLGMIKGRVAGREENTAILILGFEQLPLEEQDKFLRILQKHFKNCRKIICSVTAIIPPRKKFGIF